MINAYHTEAGILRRDDTRLATALWVDLFCPTPEEEAAVEAALGIDAPTREEMEEIEVSSRLYMENGTAYLTAILPANADGDDPVMSPVSFVLTPTHLLTVRYHAPRVFETFPPRAEKTAQSLPDAATTLIALLDAVIDRQADILERAGRSVDRLSHDIFRKNKEKGSDFQKILEDIGREGDLVSNIRDSLLTLERLIGFLANHAAQKGFRRDLRDRVKTLSRDARALSDHAGFLSGKITFLLDATLGMINIQQNAIIKIFSVAAVIFLPPTLIASIYGMNFSVMPELSWTWGYPFALGLMVLFAVLPYRYAKYRKWL